MNKQELITAVLKLKNDLARNNDPVVVASVLFYVAVGTARSCGVTRETAHAVIDKTWGMFDA